MIQRQPNLVSVVVTCYNRESYLRDCLDSLRNQTYNNLEIIFIDDASNDQSANIFRKYKGTYHSETFSMVDLQLPHNVGYEGPLTIGMFLSRGEFIAIQDADDLSHKERIEKQVEYLKDHEDIGLVGTLYSGFKDYTNGELIGLEKKANWLRSDPEKIKNIYKNGGHTICHGSIMIRGSVFDQLGGYSRRYEKEADYEFIKKCVLNGVKADNIQEVLYYYRRHSSQMSKQ